MLCYLTGDCAVQVEGRYMACYLAGDCAVGVVTRRVTWQRTALCRGAAGYSSMLTHIRSVE